MIPCMRIQGGHCPPLPTPLDSNYLSVSYCFAYAIFILQVATSRKSLLSFHNDYYFDKLICNGFRFICCSTNVCFLRTTGSQNWFDDQYDLHGVLLQNPTAVSKVECEGCGPVLWNLGQNFIDWCNGMVYKRLWRGRRFFCLGFVSSNNSAVKRHTQTLRFLSLIPSAVANFASACKPVLKIVLCSILCSFLSFKEKKRKKSK